MANGGIIGPNQTIIAAASVSERVSTFNADGNFTAQSAPVAAHPGIRKADILVIAGGGGGATGSGGGGGAGGLVAAPSISIPGCTVAVTIGGGGATGGGGTAGGGGGY